MEEKNIKSALKASHDRKLWELQSSEPDRNVQHKLQALRWLIFSWEHLRTRKKYEHAILAQYISQRLYHFGVQVFSSFISVWISQVFVLPYRSPFSQFRSGHVVGMNAGAPPCLLPKALARQAIRYHHPSRANATRRPTVLNASLTRSLSKKCNIKILTSIVGPSVGG